MYKKIIILLSLITTLLFDQLTYANMDFVNRSDVQAFIHKMVTKHDFNRHQLITVFNAVKMRPRVIQSVKYPLEQKPWYSYQILFVTNWRIRQGVKFWEKHADSLARAERMYGVPASIIVATIGVETKYGKQTGDYPVIDALANLAFSDSPRAPFFRKELEEFLLLSREQHLNPLKILGSYAGAIGQPQFMPSSYRRYAVNFSGNESIDLSNDTSDVIGSIANYYKKMGWRSNEPVAMPASLKMYRYQNLFADQNNPLKIWTSQLPQYGLMPLGNIANDQKVKIIELSGYYGNEYWLGFHNFDVIKRYNPSNLYAMAVFQLSQYIADRKYRRSNHG